MTRKALKNAVVLGDNIVLDFPKMMRQGLALIGNSGSGKTLAERHVIEETRSIASQMIFDMSGEFWTLREKFDYLLVGPNGDMPADPSIAADLARFVRERPCHIIVDLSRLE